MDKKTYKCEIRISLPIDEANLIEKIAEKEKKTKGEVIIHFLNTSPLWKEKIAKWKQFIEGIV
ncbi:MAG: hypothetical protein LBP40_04005 [Campylobacteraceae bacterium]|jgi:hypothetical protein|nr:hypothetical protein [Campylobacteraceae bacterium]